MKYIENMINLCIQHTQNYSCGLCFVHKYIDAPEVSSMHRCLYDFYKKNMKFINDNMKFDKSFIKFYASKTSCFVYLFCIMCVNNNISLKEAINIISTSDFANIDISNCNNLLPAYGIILSKIKSSKHRFLLDIE